MLFNQIFKEYISIVLFFFYIYKYNYNFCVYKNIYTCNENDNFSSSFVRMLICSRLDGEPDSLPNEDGDGDGMGQGYHS